MKCAMRIVESSDEKVEIFPVILLMPRTSKIINHFLKSKTLLGFVLVEAKSITASAQQ